MKIKNIIYILLAGFILRLILTPHGTYSTDMSCWIGWSSRLRKVGFARFYDSWSDYLPGYLYILFFWGKLLTFLETNVGNIPTKAFFKLIPIFSDLLAGFFLYKIARKFFDETKSLLVSALYLFNPAILANSALWGQADSFLASLSVASIWFLLNKKYLLSVILLAILALVKPPGIIIVPIIFLLILREEGFQKAFFLGLLSLSIFAVAFVPFAGGETLIPFIYKRWQLTLNQYPYTGLNAFNFWNVFDLRWTKDKTKFLFLSYHQWGILLFAGIYFPSIFVLLKKWREEWAENLPLLAATLGTIFYASFMFLTRVHERHLYPVFIFLAIISIFKPKYWILYFLSSLLYVLNLRFSFVWGMQKFKKIFTPLEVAVFAIGNLGISLTLFKNLIQKEWTTRAKKIKRPSQPIVESAYKKIETYFKNKKKKQPKTKLSKWFLISLMLIAALTFSIRIWRLGVPNKHIFDEVYKAFTAQEMAKGNPDAWVWGKDAPEGFHYTWTHPPLSKLAMVGTIKTFGSTPFGWRMAPLIFGIGIVFLIGLLGKELFNEKVGIIAALLAAFECLFFVQSRTGLNDIFLVFFILLASYFFTQEKWWLTGIATGLAISTKWSALYLLPFFGTVQVYETLPLLFSKPREFWENMLKKTLKSFFFLVGVAGVVYLIVYIPFFTTGHSWSKFVELQKQMWWYHTRLDATHPFTSRWWSWPIIKRPIWYYTKSFNGKIANIYAMGNPLIWWTGILTMVTLTASLLKRYSREKFLVLCGYLSFWLPWARSPRIMFLYHYLPSLAFLILSLAWQLEKFMKRRKWVVFVFLSAVIALFFYFYPRISAFPVSKDWNRQYKWFKSW